MAINTVADLVAEITPFIGQDCQIKYRVRTDKDLDTDETITGWTLLWTLFEDVGDASAVLVRTTGGSGVTISTPYATVVLTAAQMDALTDGKKYQCQLWRNDSGNKYPLTGLCPFVPQPAPPLS